MPSLPMGDLTIAVAVPVISSFASDTLWTSSVLIFAPAWPDLRPFAGSISIYFSSLHFLFSAEQKSPQRPPHHAEPRRPLRRRRNLFPLGVRHCVQYFYEWHCRCQQHRIVQQRQQPEHPPTQPNDEGLPRDEANVSTGNAGVCRLRGAGTQGGEFGPRRVPGRVRSRQGVLPVGEAFGAIIKWLGERGAAQRCSVEAESPAANQGKKKSVRWSHVLPQLPFSRSLHYCRTRTWRALQALETSSLTRTRPPRRWKG